MNDIDVTEKTGSVKKWSMWAGFTFLSIVMVCIVLLGCVIVAKMKSGTEKISLPFVYSEPYLLDSRVVRKIGESDAYSVTYKEVEAKKYGSCVNVSGLPNKNATNTKRSKFYVKRDGVENGIAIVDMQCDESIAFARTSVGGRSLLDVLAFPDLNFIRKVTTGIDRMEKESRFYYVYGYEKRKNLDGNDETLGTILVFDVPVMVRDNAGEQVEMEVRAVALADASYTENGEIVWSHGVATRPYWQSLSCVNDRCVEAKF